MLVELLITCGDFEKRPTEIMVDGNLVSSKTFDAYWDYDSDTFNSLLVELKRVFIRENREDISELLKFTDICDIDSWEDEWDSYSKTTIQFKFSKGTFTVVIDEDFNTSENFKYSHLVDFLNRNILHDTDVQIKLTIK